MAEKDKDKDYERYMSKEFKKRNAVYDPESSYLKSRKNSEKKYLDSAKDGADRVRKLQVIADETDPNVPAEKAKYRRGHVPTNEALYGMKKGGAVKKMAGGGTPDKLYETIPDRRKQKDSGTVKSTATKLPAKGDPKKDNTPLPEWLKNERDNQKQDMRNRRERELYDRGEATRLKDQGGFKKGGVTRGDGIAMRGKTKGRMV